MRAQFGHFAVMLPDPACVLFDRLPQFAQLITLNDLGGKQLLQIALKFFLVLLELDLVLREHFERALYAVHSPGSVSLGHPVFSIADVRLSLS